MIGWLRGEGRDKTPSGRGWGKGGDQEGGNVMIVFSAYEYYCKVREKWQSIGKDKCKYL